MTLIHVCVLDFILLEVIDLNIIAKLCNNININLTGLNPGSKSSTLQHIRLTHSVIIIVAVLSSHTHSSLT